MSIVDGGTPGVTVSIGNLRLSRRGKRGDMALCQAAYDMPMTIKEACDWFGVKRPTVLSWVAEGKLAACGYRGTAKTYKFGELAAEDQRRRVNLRNRPRHYRCS